jgi:hypothetical protein
MFELSVNVTGDFNRTIEAIGATEIQVRTASMRAINKTALWVQSKTAREISEQKKIQLKLIRQKLKVVKSNRQALRAFVIANLYGIKASKLGPIRQNASGASVGKHQFPGAFVARMPKTGGGPSAGHVGVFKRKTAKRLPIQEQYVQLNPEGTQIIQQTIENEASHIFRKYFDHEISYAKSTS